MRKVIVALILFTVGITSFACKSQSKNIEPVHVFITAGQSNSDGRVDNLLLPPYIKSKAVNRVDFLNGGYEFCKISQNSIDGQFVPFWPRAYASKGLWTYDAVTYYLIEQALQEEFYVVKWAVGGTSIHCPKENANGNYWSANEEWLKNTSSSATQGQSLLLSLTEAIDACIDQTLSKIERGYQIDAVLWHQGESDENYGDDYFRNLREVVGYIRNHLTQKTGKDYSQLPFVFGSIPKASLAYSDKVEIAMQRLENEDPNAYLIDMSEQGLQNDKLHFNAGAAEYLGTEMYAVLDKLLNLSNSDFRIAKYKDDKTCAISYTFDDGLREHYTLVAPELEKHNFRGTFWINGASVNQDEKNLADTTRVSWENLKMMTENGHEISNHGWLHQNLTQLDLEDMKIEIEKNDSAILANTGVLPLTFCYPYNARNDLAWSLASQNRIDTRTRQFAVSGESTEKGMESLVDGLLNRRGWGIAMVHGINYGYDNFPAEILWNHFEKVKAQEDEIWVATFGEVAAYVKERDNVRYDVIENENGFTITPRLTLNRSIYNESLTGVIERSDVAEVKIEQDKINLESQIMSDKVIFDFNPYGGAIDVQIIKRK